MPFQTTPFLPLTVQASAVSSSSQPTQQDPEPSTIAEHNHHHYPTLPPSAASGLPPSLTASTGKSNPPAPSSRPSNHSRRYTLSRFPLLRKGSRELSRTPSTHFKINSSSQQGQATAPTDSPFLATGAPRASSSIARGRDPSPAREPTTDSHEPDVITEEVEQKGHADRTRAGKPDKMHQTSSRLLRMTDDERPYTRVSFSVFHTVSTVSH